MAGAVLVLNTTYEPISYTRLARAISMVARGDAVIEESVPGKILRHMAGEYPWPKVLRLLRYIKLSVDHRPAAWSKAGVLKRDNHICGYCGKTATTVDHIDPISRGGERRCWLNTVASCVRCNNRKRDRTPAEARMTLHIVPEVPTRIKVTVKRR